jgi:hypothetical protein
MPWQAAGRSLWVILKECANVFQAPAALHLLISRNDRGRVVAHCLDFDLVTTAAENREASRRLKALLATHVESFLNTRGVSEHGDVAPSGFWLRYAQLLRRGTVYFDTLEITQDLMGEASLARELQLFCADDA